jgi:aryl-alcohol dehydrogenase-like predicted oxidoreductase
MKTRKLGALEVSEIGFGAMSFTSIWRSTPPFTPARASASAGAKNRAALLARPCSR